MKQRILFILFALGFIGGANAANITLYYSPTCPHCHHAQEFISETLAYEYPMLSVTQVNVFETENRPMFAEVLKKCEFTSGGVPVLVIGDKCFQGYGDGMQQDIRSAIESDMSPADIAIATENRQALKSDASAFKASHAERANIISEYDLAAQKKTNGGSIYLYIILVALVAGVVFALTRRGNKNK